jgi:hypothetical protein
MALFVVWLLRTGRRIGAGSLPGLRGARRYAPARPIGILLLLHSVSFTVAMAFPEHSQLR